MRGRTYEWSEAEQALREWTTAQRAAYSLRQRIERQRWEKDVLAPAQARIVAQITEGSAPVLSLPEGLVE
jgi:hypothetical protein